jgi:hypothetical protein
MTLPRGIAYEGEGEARQAVPFVMPEVYQADAENAGPSRPWDIFLNRVLDVLEGPPKSAAVRIAAVKRIAGRDDRTLRVISAELGCPLSSLHDAIKAAETKLFATCPNTISEEK